MNPFRNILNQIKNFIFPQETTQRVFEVAPAVSQTMERNINLWYAMYVNQPPWETPYVVPVGLPAAICREVSRPTLSELSVSITGSKRADFLNERFQVAKENFYRNLELGLATGGIAFKPYLYNETLMIDATSAAAFKPTKFDPSGICVSGVFREKARVNGKCYVRLEYHDLTGNTYTIQNKAFHSDTSGGIGNKAELSEVPEWKNISPEVTIKNVEGPLFAYFRTPQSNNVETEDMAGMSIYGGAVVDLIRRADEQWDLLHWEYKSGERKVFMDVAETTAKNFDKRLYETGPFSRDGNFFEQFEPEIRDEPIYRGFQNILKQIEFQVGLSYGTISDPQTVEKTATEIKSSKQRMYVTIDSIQKALQHTFDSLIYAMDVYTSLYHLAPAGNYEVAYDWGDSVLDDADSIERERANDRQDMAAGIMNDWEYRAKWYGETEDDAKANLPKMADMTTEKQEEVE